MKRRFVLAASSGLLFALAHPPFGIWSLVFVAPIPLFLAFRSDVERGEGRRNALIGFVAGMAQWLPTLYWSTHTFRHYGGLPLPVAMLVWVVFAAIFALFESAPFGWGMGRLLRFGPGSAALGFPLLWVTFDWIRSWLFTGFPWAFAGHALVPRPELLWPSTLLGEYFLSALVVGSGLALLIAIRDVGTGRSLGAVVALAGIVGLFAAGVVQARSARRSGSRVVTIRVAAIQPGVAQELRWSLDDRQRIYADLKAQTRSVAKTSQASLLVWSESASPFDFDASPPVRDDVQLLAREFRTTILLNTIREETDERYFNSARVIRPDGVISEAYDKRHLVPFGEYVPAQWAFGWAGKIVRGIGDFSSASGPPRLLSVPFLDDGASFEALIGVGICYEAVYPDVFRDAVREGANLVVTLTNDGWYGGLGAEEQHWNGAVASAVSCRRSLVRAAVSGIPGIVGPSGEVLGRRPLGEKGDVVADVPLGAEIPLSVEAGDLFPWTAGLISLCAILFAGLRRPHGAKV